MKVPIYSISVAKAQLFRNTTDKKHPYKGEMVALLNTVPHPKF
jgi:hypothetical protein